MDDNLKIELIYNPKTKNLTINGAIMDRLFTYGILEMAKDVLKGFYESMTKEDIDKANAEARKNDAV